MANAVKRNKRQRNKYNDEQRQRRRQVFLHAHFHIIPRFADDGLRHWPGKPYANKEEAAKIAEKIKDSF